MVATVLVVLVKLVILIIIIITTDSATNSTNVKQYAQKSRKKCTLVNNDNIHVWNNKIIVSNMSSRLGTRSGVLGAQKLVWQLCGLYTFCISSISCSTSGSISVSGSFTGIVQIPRCKAVYAKVKEKGQDCQQC